jgi:hypothetical protein
VQVIEDDQQQLNGVVQQSSSMPGSSSSVGSLHPTSSIASSGGVSAMASQGGLESHATSGPLGAFPGVTGGAQSDSGEAATRGRGAQQFHVGTWPFNTSGSAEPKRCNSKLRIRVTVFHTVQWWRHMFYGALQTSWFPRWLLLVLLLLLMCRGTDAPALLQLLQGPQLPPVVLAVLTCYQVLLMSRTCMLLVRHLLVWFWPRDSEVAPWPTVLPQLNAIMRILLGRSLLC